MMDVYAKDAIRRALLEFRRPLHREEADTVSRDAVEPCFMDADLFQERSGSNDQGGFTFAAIHWSIHCAHGDALDSLANNARGKN